MSGYNTRRTPAQYLADLNAIPSPTDTSNQPPESYSLDDDLAIFTNAEFFDFDIGHNMEQQPPVNFDAAAEERLRRENAAAKPAGSNGKGLEINAGTYIVLRTWREVGMAPSSLIMEIAECRTMTSPLQRPMSSPSLPNTPTSYIIPCNAPQSSPHQITP